MAEEHFDKNGLRELETKMGLPENSLKYGADPGFVIIPLRKPGAKGEQLTSLDTDAPVKALGAGAKVWHYNDNTTAYPAIMAFQPGAKTDEELRQAGQKFKDAMGTIGLEFGNPTGMETPIYNYEPKHPLGIIERKLGVPLKERQDAGGRPVIAVDAELTPLEAERMERSIDGLMAGRGYPLSSAASQSSWSNGKAMVHLDHVLDPKTNTLSDWWNKISSENLHDQKKNDQFKINLRGNITRSQDVATYIAPRAIAPNIEKFGEKLGGVEFTLINGQYVATLPTPDLATHLKSTLAEIVGNAGIRGTNANSNLGVMPEFTYAKNLVKQVDSEIRIDPRFFSKNIGDAFSISSTNVTNTGLTNPAIDAFSSKLLAQNLSDTKKDLAAVSAELDKILADAKAANQKAQEAAAQVEETLKKLQPDATAKEAATKEHEAAVEAEKKATEALERANTALKKANDLPAADKGKAATVEAATGEATKATKDLATATADKTKAQSNLDTINNANTGLKEKADAVKPEAKIVIAQAKLSAEALAKLEANAKTAREELAKIELTDGKTPEKKNRNDQLLADAKALLSPAKGELTNIKSAEKLTLLNAEAVKTKSGITDTAPASPGAANPANQAAPAGPTDNKNIMNPDGATATPADPKKPGNIVDDNKFGMMAGIGSLLMMIAVGFDPIMAILGALIMGAIGSFMGDKKGVVAQFLPEGMGGPKKEQERGQAMALHLDATGKVTTQPDQAAYVLEGSLVGTNFQVTGTRAMKNGKPVGELLSVGGTIAMTETKNDKGEVSYAVAPSNNLGALAKQLGELTKPINSLAELDKDNNNILTAQELALLKTYDKNHDNKISRDELPVALQAKFDDLLKNASNKKQDGNAPTEIDLGGLPKQNIGTPQAPQLIDGMALK